MTARRYFLACLVLTAVALAWNGFVHLVILRSIDARVRHLFRADLSSRGVQSVLLTIAIIVLFVFGYARYARLQGMRGGITYGLFFGFVAGVLVDGNQYVLYPIPGEVALLWFCSGLVEFTMYGFILSKFVAPRFIEAQLEKPPA